MGSFSIWHWLIVAGITLLLFGNRLPRMLGDLGIGIRNLKAGLAEETDASPSRLPRD
ncbi:twin-arginine translocase TatA/TatE family subunit [Nitrospirillum sp. BR 11164]|uniref:twin-arginine translocase TatA/TatE family subunit n=1 Tax=Nitrospirillum sp. BR 11164 TaxID=3104324 RepID=UPI002AFDFBBA|nr:twin-arginine translocase TatA/TatE family subunit [Nitrospirillum sp. BR 11164]MEA1648222.1 twin-arginine translocase TatA/TatE family subunit [Nitrospirillum sp. BR 11164]